MMKIPFWHLQWDSTLEHIISPMLDEEVCHGNVEIQAVATKSKGSGINGEVRVKKEEML
jgi:hypothetical protein